MFATQTAFAGVAPPTEDALDTARIQAALDLCPSGQAVKIATSDALNAFVSAPLTLPAGVTLWIDTGTTLYASRDAALYGSACGTGAETCDAALITASGADSAVMGSGTIDGQGGERMIGQIQSWWGLGVALRPSGLEASNPSLIETAAAASSFTLYGVPLHDSPKFHVVLNGAGFVVWGTTIVAPVNSTNSNGERGPSGASFEPNIRGEGVSPTSAWSATQPPSIARSVGSRSRSARPQRRT